MHALEPAAYAAAAEDKSFRKPKLPDGTFGDSELAVTLKSISVAERNTSPALEALKDYDGPIFFSYTKLEAEDPTTFDEAKEKRKPFTAVGEADRTKFYWVMTPKLETGQATFHGYSTIRHGWKDLDPTSKRYDEDAMKYGAKQLADFFAA